MTLPRVAALVVVGLLAAGCASRGPDDELAGVPVSAELVSSLASARDAAPGPELPDLVRAARLEVAIQRPASRQAAADTLYALWDAEPTSFLWVNLATQYHYLIRRGEALRAMIQRPGLADEATAAGAYFRSRMAPSSAARADLLAVVEARADELDALARVLLHLQYARTEAKLGRPLDGVRRLLAVAPLAGATGGVRLATALWQKVAANLLDADRLDDALHAAALATELARRTGDQNQILAGRVLTARVHAARLECERALAIFDECLVAAERHELPWIVTETCSEAGAAATAVGDLRRAMAYDVRGLAFGIAVADSLNVPRILVNLAYSQRCLGQLDSCGVYLARARTWVDRFDDPVNKARLLLHEAKYLSQMGEYAAAESLLTAARQDLARVGSPADEGVLFLDLIELGLETGRTAIAYRGLVELERRRLSLRDRLPNQNRLAELEIAATELLTRHGEFHRAAQARDRARAALGDDRESRNVWRFHRSAGELARQRGDTLVARREFTRCLDLAREERDPDRLAVSRFQLGMLELAAGRGDAAREYFGAAEIAFGTSYRTNLASQLLLGVSCIQEGDGQAALKYLRQADTGIGPHAPRDLRIRLRIELGRAQAQVGDLAAAEASLQRARSDLLSATWQVQVAELQDSEASARRDLSELLIGLYVDRPDLLAGDVARHTLRLADEGRGFVPPDRIVVGSAPLVAFFVGRGRSFAWTAIDGRLEVRELPGRAGLREDLLPVLADLERPSRPRDRQRAAGLGRLLLGPLADWRPAGGTLRVITDDALAAVPWAALPLGEEEYLLDRCSVREVLSLAGLASASEPVSADRLTILALGQDAAAGRSLRHAEAEARRVAALWPASRSICLTGSEAVFPADLTGVGVIHVASHATVFSGAPGRSVLRLTTSSEEAPLTLDDVGALELDSALVYLSCCEAARPTAGGGLSDFVRAFLAAGAQAVVASSTRVDDEASAYLAERFYSEWRAGKSRAAALRAAQLATRAARGDWRHPYYWASYRLIGDGS